MPSHRRCIVCNRKTERGQSRCSDHPTGWAAAPSYGSAHATMRKRVAREEPRCRQCGSAGPWHLDHILNRAAGGTDTRSNYQRLCIPCHTAKTRAETKQGQIKGRGGSKVK